MTAYCYESPSFDPYFNLALEEYFLERCGEEKAPILYFWRNDRTVIIGRNQNAYTECSLEYARAHHITVVRRKTGGGAVYQDRGNQNYSVILPSDEYDKQRSTRMIINGLRGAGISAEANGRNDIVLGEHKISGNAYYSDVSVGLHHGTILFDVNLDVMTQALNVSKAKLAKRGIPSVRARVANLHGLYPQITMEEIRKAITESFRKEYAASFRPEMEIDQDRVAFLRGQYQSEEWVYGKVKDYGETHLLESGGCLLTVSLDCSGARVRQVSIASDSLDPDRIEREERIINETLTQEDAWTPEAVLNMIQETLV